MRPTGVCQLRGPRERGPLRRVPCAPGSASRESARSRTSRPAALFAVLLTCRGGAGGSAGGRRRNGVTGDTARRGTETTPPRPAHGPATDGRRTDGRGPELRCAPFRAPRCVRHFSAAAHRSRTDCSGRPYARLIRRGIMRKPTPPAIIVAAPTSRKVVSAEPVSASSSFGASALLDGWLPALSGSVLPPSQSTCRRSGRRCRRTAAGAADGGRLFAAAGAAVVAAAGVTTVVAAAGHGAARCRHPGRRHPVSPPVVATGRHPRCLRCRHRRHRR